MTRQRLSEDTRQRQIMDAAARVGARDGLMQLTVRSVAREASISHGLVMHHFGNMESLQIALYGWLVEQLLTIPTQACMHGTARQRLLATLNEQREYLQDKSELVGLLMEFRLLGRSNDILRERVRQELNAVHLPYLQFTREIVAARPDAYAHISAEDLARLIGHIMVGYEINRYVDPGLEESYDSVATIGTLLAE